MSSHKQILYQGNKILNYMIALTRLKPGETLFLSPYDIDFLHNYFKSYKNNYDFSALIAIAQFINNFDDDNTFPSEEILKDFFENGKISYYDGSNDLIKETYNSEDHKGIEIIKDDFKGLPNEYELKFKFVRNAIAHSDFEITNGQIKFSQEALISQGHLGEFVMKMDIPAFLSLIEVLTEKRFSKEGIDEVGYIITPKHYVSISNEHDLKSILPLAMKKIILKGDKSQKEKEEIKNKLGPSLYKNIQYQRGVSIRQARLRGEKQKFKVNDKEVLLNLERAYRQTASELNSSVKIVQIPSNSKEIKYLKKYFKYYGYSFYNTSSGKKDYTRMYKNDVILDVLLLNEKDRLNINYSTFLAREMLLKQKSGVLRFEDLPSARFEGLAALKNILIAKSQLVFCQLKQNTKKNVAIHYIDIDRLENINMTIQRNGMNFIPFDSSSPIPRAKRNIRGNKVAKEKILAHVSSEKERTTKIQQIDSSTQKSFQKIYNYLDDSLFSKIRNSITHGHMEVVQGEENIKLVFKDYKDEDSIPIDQKRNRNRNRLANVTPDFYMEIELDDFLDLCNIIEESSFEKEDKIETIELDDRGMSKRLRFFLMSPVKPMLFRALENRGFITETDKQQSIGDYTFQKLKQHVKDNHTSLLTGMRF